MCGRFTLQSPAEDVAAAFDISTVPAHRPLFNIAPTSLVTTVGRKPDGSRGFAAFRWGLIPNWSPDGKMGPANAKAETVAELPTFRAALRGKRCLVVADGFYEWKTTAAGKDPYHFRLKTGKPFAFAGLWDYWPGAAGPVFTCAIITTAPNALVGPVHNRMPVILPPSAYDVWTDRGVTDPGAVLPLLTPYPADLMDGVAVSRFVNSTRNQGPDCLVPAPAPAASRGLFPE